jgi:predicted MFS family arabinose efflux permease
VGIGSGAFLGGVVLRSAGIAAIPAVAATLVAIAIALQFVPVVPNRTVVAVDA